MTGRTVLVTGAARGIGAAIAARLKADGWTVLAPSRGELDLADPESVTAYLTANEKTAIDGLVINAGVNTPAPIGSLSAADWAHIQQVNCTSAFMLATALCPAMADRGYGRLVAISSAYATRARTGRAAYSASKSATS